MRRAHRSGIGLAMLVIVGLVMTPPAEAAPKKPRHSVYTGKGNTTPLSLDGRNTGRPRTCGYSTFQYDTRGVPYGPYCH